MHPPGGRHLLTTMTQNSHKSALRDLPLSKVYHLIEPGPVVLVATASEGRSNVMTMSYHMVIDDSRPLIACMLGPWDYSFAALRASKECVIAVPTVDLADKVVEIGNCSGEDVDKFRTFALTTAKASKVHAPLITDCLANLECRIADDAMVEKYNLFILEVVKAWIDADRAERRMIHHNGDGTFVVDGHHLDLKKKMVKWPTYTSS